MSDQEPIILGYASTSRRILRVAMKCLVGILVLLILVYMLLPSHGSRPLALRTVCSTNLSSIAKSCLTYSEGNRGALPLNLEMLCMGGERAYMSPKQLVCPVSKLPYIYISSQTNTADPRNIMAYEPISYHKGQGGNIAFLDGSVRWFNHPETIVAETNARIAAATQPTQ